jgi:hypothetical protein
VGTAWRFPGAQSADAVGPVGAATASREGGVFRVVPDVIGAYRITVDGKAETRVAAPAEREIDLRPRRVASGSSASGFGERRAQVDVSGQVALILLGLGALELVLRVVSGRRARARADDALATGSAGDA